MKFFGWMQSKRTSRPHGSKNSSVVSSAPDDKKMPPEEYREWPAELFSIGTLGNIARGEKNQEGNQPDASENPIVFDDLTDFTAEEVTKLQKELMNLLSQNKPAICKTKPETTADLPLNRFLNCPSSLDVDRRINSSQSQSRNPRNGDGDDLDIERTISAIIGKCREICEDQKKNQSVGKKSISFLLKKISLYKSRLAPPVPSLRDTLQESKMEKLLRTLLHKRMQMQSSSRASSIKRYLEDKPKLTTEKRDDNDNDSDDDDTDECERTKENGKWVKTDSDYIVLEI